MVFMRIKDHITVLKYGDIIYVVIDEKSMVWEKNKLSVPIKNKKLPINSIVKEQLSCINFLFDIIRNRSHTIQTEKINAFV